MKQKKERQPVVLAGNVQQSLHVAHVESQGAHVDTVNQSDPWRNWIKNHGGSGLNQNSNVPKVVSSVPLVQPPRKLEAPIEDKLQRLNEQMQHIREVTGREIKALQDGMLMQKLEKISEDQRLIIDSSMKPTASEFRALKAGTSQKFQSMADLCKESLHPPSVPMMVMTP